MRRVIILGSTGSIGTQALEVIAANPDRFEVVGLAAGKNVELLEQQKYQFKISNAVLGAAGLGDIGRHFPDTDARFKGADSWVLLQHTGRLIREAGYRIGNIDSTVIAQAPKLAPFMSAMCERIAQALEIEAQQVNVKAKTAEKMGPVGLGQSMEARALALIY